MRPVALVGALLVTVGLAAQTYIPLLRPLAAWEDQNECFVDGGNQWNRECLRYNITGDSVVNDTSYSIFRRTGYVAHSYDTYPELNTTYWYNNQFVGLLREDTAERLVYIRRPGWSVERLFYDFSVGVGFYPPTYLFDYAEDLEVTSVDTLWLTDGPHRRMNFFYGYHSIIEGVGWTWGFMNSDMSGDMCYPGQLLNHAVGDSVDYDVAGYHCPLSPTTGVSSTPATSLHLGPSPTSDLCHLYEAPRNAPFVIRSMEGRALRYGLCSGQGTTTIDLRDLPASIYLLEVFDTNGSLKARIVKE